MPPPIKIEISTNFYLLVDNTRYWDLGRVRNIMFVTTQSFWLEIHLLRHDINLHVFTNIFEVLLITVFHSRFRITLNGKFSTLNTSANSTYIVVYQYLCEQNNYSMKLISSYLKLKKQALS